LDDRGRVLKQPPHISCQLRVYNWPRLTPLCMMLSLGPVIHGFYDMYVSFDAFGGGGGGLVRAHAWCAGSRVHLTLGCHMRRTRPTHTARTEVALVAHSADQGMQGCVCGVLQTVCVCWSTLMCARMVVCNSWLARAWPEGTHGADVTSMPSHYPTNPLRWIIVI
jgi:hypothetical protein